MAEPAMIVRGAVGLGAVDRRFLVDHHRVGVGLAATRADFDAGHAIRPLELIEELRHQAFGSKP